jgi:hypothetical protein
MAGEVVERWRERLDRRGDARTDRLVAVVARYSRGRVIMWFEV